METVFELQKRVLFTDRWRHVGYFRTRRDAETEQLLPMGTISHVEWRIVSHTAMMDPEQPDRAFLIDTREIPLGRTAFFV